MTRHLFAAGKIPARSSMNDMDKWNKHQARTAARHAREIAKRVVEFSPLSTDEIRAKLASRGATPWERRALERILREREDA